MGKEKGTDNKNNKSLTLNPLGAQVGKEKGTDNKNNKPLTLNPPRSQNLAPKGSWPGFGPKGLFPKDPRRQF